MDKNAKMERRLSFMLEYQRFVGNKRLAAMNEDVLPQDGEKQ